jgi:hypothetical protein
MTLAESIPLPFSPFLVLGVIFAAALAVFLIVTRSPRQ